MSLNKTTYVDDETVIYADNLNSIQDEIIQNCVTGAAKTFDTTKKNGARATVGIPNVSSGSTIALADLTASVVSTFE